MYMPCTYMQMGRPAGSMLLQGLLVRATAIRQAQRWLNVHSSAHLLRHWRRDHGRALRARHQLGELLGLRCAVGGACCCRGLAVHRRHDLELQVAAAVCAWCGPARYGLSCMQVAVKGQHGTGRRCQLITDLPVMHSCHIVAAAQHSMLAGMYIPARLARRALAAPLLPRVPSACLLLPLATGRFRHPAAAQMHAVTLSYHRFAAQAHQIAASEAGGQLSLKSAQGTAFTQESTR